MLARKLILVATASIALAACGSQQEAETGPEALLSGTVIEKKHEPEYTYPMYIPISCGNGCTSQMMIMQYVPATYDIFIGGCDPDCRTNRIPVDPGSYEDLQVGDRYPRSYPAVPPKEGHN